MKSIIVIVALWQSLAFLIIAKSTPLSRLDPFKGVPAREFFFIPLIFGEKKYSKNATNLETWIKKNEGKMQIMTWSFIVSNEEFKKYGELQNKKNIWRVKASKEISRPLKTRIKSLQLESGDYRISIGIAF